MTEIIISVEQLSYIYGANRDAALHGTALQDITLQIEAGSCAAIIGVTGSGKSTLIQHFNGLLLPTSGSVMVDGIEVNTQGRDLTRLRQRVGMLFQFPEGQLFEKTVFTDVAFGPRRLYISRHEVRLRVLQALEQVGLPPREYAQRSPFELSGGQRRRVALAGILAMRPKILILDEPGVGLDAEGRRELAQHLSSLKQQGITIVLVSHDMSEVAALADQLFVLHHGHLVMQGSPRQVFSQAVTLREYGLLPPPLGSLLALLRQRGLAIPEDITTVDEAFQILSNQRLAN